MDRYHIVEIHTSQLMQTAVVVRSTSPWVLKELHELVETQGAQPNARAARLPNDQWYQYTFWVKEGEPTRFAWWLLQFLCKEGWEPFSHASNRFESGPGEETYLLRHVTAEQSE